MKTLLKVLTTSLLLLSLSPLWAEGAQNCTAAKKRAICDKEVVKNKVEEVCKILEAKGEGGFEELKQLRYDCCGDPDYVYVANEANILVVHPIKPNLVGKDLSNFQDAKGFFIVKEGNKLALSTKEGGWINYVWPKAGETEQTPKTTFCKQCTQGPAGKIFIACSGTWL